MDLNLFREYIRREKRNYMEAFSKRDWLAAALTSDPQYQLWRYHKRMRVAGYYYSRYKSSKGLLQIIYLVMYLFSRRMRNKLGNRLSIDIREQTFDEGLVIYHNNIVVNGWSKIGKNCRLHGHNIIGNNGATRDTPEIGDNVDIGVGAIIIGGIKIANNVKIGAGAVVVKSCMTEGATLIGVPAKIVHSNIENAGVTYERDINRS